MAHAWDTSRGDADVTILNGQVNAKLFFEDSKECKSRRRVRSRVRTWWFGRRFITDFGNGETFRGLARYVPQGSERDRSDYVLKLDCDDRADADGEQEGDRSAQAIPENVAVRRACLIDRDLTEISLTF